MASTHALLLLASVIATVSAFGPSPPPSGCPGSPAMFYAQCQMSVNFFSSSCADVTTEITDRVSGKDGWFDPHNRGTYTLDSNTGGVLKGHRKTGGGGKYTDKFEFTLKAASSGGCQMTACSASQSNSVLDYSTNYCNLHNLYCGSQDGCKIVSKDLKDTETISSCKYHDKGQCIAGVEEKRV